jgi:ubiquinol-cytochrome c reductase cytochrome b subunit
LLLFFLPWLDKSPVKSANYRPTYRIFLIVLLLDVLVLGYLGGAEATPVTVLLSQIAAGYYFAHFLVVLPIVSTMERPRPLPNSITEAVLAKHGGTSLAHSAAQA